MQRYNVSQITISPVANGFIVTVPLPEESFMPMKEVGEMLSSLQENMHKDPIIKNAEDVLRKQQEQDKEKVIPRDQSMHVFKTFREVIAYLTVTFEDGFKS